MIPCSVCVSNLDATDDDENRLYRTAVAQLFASVRALRAGRAKSMDGRIQPPQEKQPKIENRSFCTQRCLQGIASGEPSDEECPNFGSHETQHIDPQELLSLTRDQLATDRGSDADACLLQYRGEVGALVKIRLSPYGYTFVAKGV